MGARRAEIVSNGIVKLILYLGLLVAAIFAVIKIVSKATS